MRMSWEDHRSGTVLTIEGEFVSEDMDVFRRRCEDRLVPGVRWIMDLRSLERIDSSGIESLLWLSESVQRSGGQLRVVGGEGQPAAALHVTRVEYRLAVHPSLESAARSFARGQAA